MKIGVKIRDGQILLEFETQAGQTATVELPPEDAQQVGLALIARRFSTAPKALSFLLRNFLISFLNYSKTQRFLQNFSHDPSV